MQKTATHPGGERLAETFELFSELMKRVMAWEISYRWNGRNACLASGVLVCDAGLFCNGHHA
jgi:hypothetical protein